MPKIEVDIPKTALREFERMSTIPGAVSVEDYCRNVLWGHALDLRKMRERPVDDLDAMFTDADEAPIELD